MKAGVRAAILAAAVSLLSFAAPAHAATHAEPTIGFRPVLTHVAPATATPTTAPVDLMAARATVASCDVAAVEALAGIPTTTERAARPDACVVFPERSGGSSAARYYLGPTVAVAIRDARARLVSGQGWTVGLVLTKAGAKAWDRLAQEQFHQQVAITYEGAVVSAPTIQPNDEKFSSFDGTAVVSGSFGRKEARALATAARGVQGR
jgi:preprotein translocase subunit SecD